MGMVKDGIICLRGIIYIIVKIEKIIKRKIENYQINVYICI